MKSIMILKHKILANQIYILLIMLSSKTILLIYFISVSDSHHFENNTISWTRVIKLNLPDWFYIMLGCVLTLVLGLSLPAFAIIISEYFEVGTYYKTFLLTVL